MTVHRIKRLREIALPLGLLLVPMVMSVVGPGDLLILSFPVALLIGFFLSPNHSWPIWIGSIVLVWVVYGCAVLLGALPEPGEAGDGETVWSFMIEAAIFMAVLVLLPLWLGRSAGQVVRDLRRHTRA